MRVTIEKGGLACSVSHADPNTDALCHFKHARLPDSFQHAQELSTLLVWMVLIFSIQFLLCSLPQTVVKYDSLYSKRTPSVTAQVQNASMALALGNELAVV